MSVIKQVSGTAIPLLLDDIDTDRIIPARFLRCVTFDGLGEHAFADDRKQDSDHPFNEPTYQNASVLISGRNFGCGSSREHAPQSLMRWGIRVVIAESFAEIFAGNCTALGIAAVRAARDDLQSLCAVVRNDPATKLTVDLESMTVTAGELTCSITMPESSRDSLMTGQWDFLSQLLSASADVKAHAEKLPYLAGF